MPRSAWKTIAEGLSALGSSGIETLASEAETLVHESDANFRVVSEHQARPWKLAVVPLVIDAASWTTLAEGLRERVTLLEAVLGDLLGPQRLIKEHVLPAELLSANPYFFRAFHDLPSIGPRLTLVATDLARDQRGNWWVTGDRTRAPSGLGYALENRVITSRVLPHLMRRSNVLRLASFFASLQTQLCALAPRMRDNPRVAILTPGKQSYRYMEDAYLARYLGYTLVQGRDLAVRGHRLNLKTLGGLLPIEVLWRHVSDGLLDPLELDSHSTHGVTGLLQSVRDRTVAVTNSIGSSLVQMPALLPYLSAANQFLFGSELALPTTETHWCGSPGGLQRTIDGIDDFLIRPAFAISGDPPVDARSLSAEDRAGLISSIKERPHDYVAQARAERSTTPVWENGAMQSWHVALRSFQLQSSGGVNVLPGGLVRVSPDAGLLDQSPASGRLGQDCWIVSEQPVDHAISLLPKPDATIELTRVGSELPSRVGENLFWMGRYAERVESIARLLRTCLVRITGENDAAELPDLPRLVAALAAMGQIEPDYAINGLGDALPQLEQVLPDSFFNRDRAQGLQAGVMNLVDKATEVRDRISLDAYRIIARIGDGLIRPAGAEHRDMGAVIERINRLITDLIALSGLANEGMTRTHGWRFLQIGRRLERALQTSELVSSTLVTVVDDERPILESVLRATDSLMTYRSRYLLRMHSVAAIDLLVNDETNPRSIAFQMTAVKELLDQLPNDESQAWLGADQRIAEDLWHRIRMLDARELDLATGGQRSNLKTLLEQLIADLPRLSNAVTARYLIHTSEAQELTGRQDDSGSPPDPGTNS